MQRRRPEEDRTAATGNVRRNSGEVWICGFLDMLVADTPTESESSSVHASVKYYNEQRERSSQSILLRPFRYTKRVAVVANKFHFI